jgi:arylsulfatase A-like enzyme
MNIVLVVIDTLRYDHVGAHGNSWIRTPNMDRLAAESWVFDRCYVGSYPTIPHRTDVITGRYGGPFHAWQPLPFDVPTLPRALADAGYCTQLIHDTPHLVNGGHNFDWPFHAWMPVRGAEVDRPWIDASNALPSHWLPDPLFDFVTDDPAKHKTLVTYARANRERRTDEDWNAATLFLTASEFLKDNRSRDNFFLWVDCFDPHEPWDVPPEYAKLYADDPDYDGRVDPRAFFVRDVTGVDPAAVERIRALYAAKVSWVDRWLGTFLDTLAETGLADNTAVILTADHGTKLGEYGQVAKRAPVQEAEGHVPMWVHLPGGESGRSDALVQPQDVFATVANLGGADVPEGVESFDLLVVARGERPGRSIALAGPSADRWDSGDLTALFTAFDAEWQLEVAATPEGSALRRRGELPDITAGHSDVVERLHAAAIDEVARRGAHPALIEWLRSGGQGEIPADCPRHDHWPKPPGYTRYFNRLYLGE